MDSSSVRAMGECVQVQVLVPVGFYSGERMASGGCCCCAGPLPMHVRDVTGQTHTASVSQQGLCGIRLVTRK